MQFNLDKTITPDDEVKTTGAAFEQELPQSPTSSKLTITPAHRQSCAQRMRLSNLKITVPLRSRVSFCEAILVLIINLVLPGLGTAILACYASEKFYISDTALELARKKNQTEELFCLIRSKTRQYKRRVLIIALLQFISVLFALIGWFWALSTSIQLLRDTRTYSKQ